VTFHLVLFRPRPDVSATDRDSLLAAMRAAAESIPSVRRFEIGERVANPPRYLLDGFPDFPYVAWLEFEDEAGLHAYLAHPLHVDLGRRFNEAAEAALIYDFNSLELTKGVMTSRLGETRPT
jgi:hypothetical protein